MKKNAEELKIGDKILIAGEILIIENIEISDIGKQGTKKCRIVAKKKDGENIILIRPSNYPFQIV